MIGAGRPLRFVALVTGGWVALRVLVLWQQDGDLPRAVREALPLPRFAEAQPAVVPPKVEMRHVAIVPAIKRTVSRQVIPSDAPQHIELAVAPMVAVGAAPAATIDAAPIPPALPVADPAKRWSISSWLLLRDGNGLGVGRAPQLGGSQAGVRIDRSIGSGFALTARFAAALRGRQREIAPGVSWQPGALPVRITVEQRIAIDGGRSGTAIGIAGGVWQALPGGLQLESYGQTGAFASRRGDAYADGMLRIARPVIGGIDIGVGTWGGAQRGAERLDIGPSLGVRLPIADGTARLTLDWRQRIAGNAAPGSGPALTLGTDF